MPNRFQENIGCARASFSNEGLCPGDSGNTVGERNIISTTPQWFMNQVQGQPLGIDTK